VTGTVAQSNAAYMQKGRHKNLFGPFNHIVGFHAKIQKSTAGIKNRELESKLIVNKKGMHRIRNQEI